MLTATQELLQRLGVAEERVPFDDLKCETLRCRRIRAKVLGPRGIVGVGKFLAVRCGKCVGDDVDASGARFYCRSFSFTDDNAEKSYHTSETVGQSSCVESSDQHGGESAVARLNLASARVSSARRR